MGMILSSMGSLAKGEANAQAAEYNQAIAKQNADIANQQGEAAMQSQQRSAARTMGAMRANYGASGVQSDSGSAMDVWADSARMATLDMLTIKYNSDLKAQGFTQQSKIMGMAADNARTASYYEAYATLEQGAMQAAKAAG